MKDQSLKDQLIARMAIMATAAKQALGAGPFGTGESRKDFEHRIMNDESAWTNVNNKNQGILPI
ncbi:MAG: hypothetical protein WC455_16835 [Dehalococcoidia bacterium]|jgi:hypothetical protein